MNWPPSWTRLDTRFDRVGSWDVHVRYRHADAPTVVLVHGLGVSSRYLAATALALHARGFGVEAPDLPGYGRTRSREALDLSGLADALVAWTEGVHPASRPVLLANSFGCQIVAQAAARAPGITSGLVLVGPTVDRRARSARTQAVRWISNAPREPAGLGAVIALDYLQCGVVRPVTAFRSALDDALEVTASQLTVPVLLVRGEDDPIAPRRWLDDLAAATTDARVVELAGAAHTANFTAPEALADVTAEFTREVTGGG